jgi:CubicO group peptidase (beta-lactamase class C family)
MVAQHLVEKLTKKSLASFMSGRIFQPLNMTSTFYSFATANSTGRLSESFTPYGRRIPHWFNKDDMSVIGGAGGILSTTTDLVKWAKALLGVTDSTAVGIPFAVLQECMSPQALVMPGYSATYGFGWIQQNVIGTNVGRLVTFDAISADKLLAGLA